MGEVSLVQMSFVAGSVLTEEGFESGFVEYDASGLVAVGWGECTESVVCEGLIVPCFVNGHTHTGDAFIRKQGRTIPHDLEMVVAPPDGLKHQWLREAAEGEIVEGMVWFLQEMRRHGVCGFCDFRENGLKGVSFIKNVLEESEVNGIVLGRPEKLCFDGEEIAQILASAEGIGLSSLADWDVADVVEIARLTHEANKLFALHVSEQCREDIDQVLALEPDLVVHMTQASSADIAKVAEQDIPIVICPESNQYFGLEPQYALLKKHQNRVLIGTDNAMVVPPDLLAQIRLIQSQTSVFSLEELLHMITYSARKALNLDDFIPGSNFPRSCIVLDPQSLVPLMEIR